ncbi:MAG TPA: hypothetical protein VD738_04470 [Nitrospira sp.]|nr:hypothetical protein [Nitrospira sp.]
MVFTPIRTLGNTTVRTRATIKETDEVFVVSAVFDLAFTSQSPSGPLHAQVEINDLEVSRADNLLAKWRLSKTLRPELEFWRPDIDQSIESLREEWRARRLGSGVDATGIPQGPTDD